MSKKCCASRTLTLNIYGDIWTPIHSFSTTFGSGLYKRISFFEPINPTILLSYILSQRFAISKKIFFLIENLFLKCKKHRHIFNLFCLFSRLEIPKNRFLCYCILKNIFPSVLSIFKRVQVGARPNCLRARLYTPPRL